MAHLIPQTRSSLVRLSAPTMEALWGQTRPWAPRESRPNLSMPFLILPQESQLQALVPPSNGSFLRAGPFYSQEFTLLSPLRGIPRT